MRLALTLAGFKPNSRSNKSKSCSLPIIPSSSKGDPKNKMKAPLLVDLSAQ